MIEVKLPELGENITAGDVLKVLVSPGDTIEAEQPLLELETDKATIEVPSSVSGTVNQMHVKAGDKVTVGQVIATIEDGASAAEGAAAPAAPASQKESRSQRRDAASARGTVPGQGETRQEVAKGDGDRAEQDRAEQDRAEEDEEAPVAGPAPRRGEVVDISRGARTGVEAEASGGREVVAAAPSVRRLARELGVEIDAVPGSGPGGRIAIEDVKAYAKRLIQSGAGRAVPRPAAAPPEFSRWGDVERRRMSGIRRKTAERLSAAWTSVPHVTQHDRADITDLDRLRQRYEKRIEQAGGKLTVTAIALKIVAAALKLFPQVNASIDVENEEIIYKKYIHIGVAVDTERGLLVPVVRDVDRKSILELSVELAQTAERARARKLTLEEMEGGSFTITNLGGIGGTYFTPIVNAPEVAILGLSRGTIEPVFVGGTVQPRLMLPLSLSYDHRAVDGADAIRFLRWVAEAFEQPFLLPLQA